MGAPSPYLHEYQACVTALPVTLLRMRDPAQIPEEKQPAHVAGDERPDQSAEQKQFAQVAEDTRPPQQAEEKQSGQTDESKATPLVDPEDIDFVYQIEGDPSQVDIFELARVLDSFGNVLQESYRTAYPEEGDLVVKVKPFEQGSFLVDLALTVQQNSGYLFVASHPEILEHAKQILEYLGFIRKVNDIGTSLLELLRGLKTGKAERIEQKGPDHYEYHATDGGVMPVNSTVNALYNNPVINHNTFNIIAPVERDSVTNLLTYLKNDRESSEVRISKEDADAVRAFVEPSENEIKTEVLEDTTTKILNPKSGNYGQTTGTWSFTIAGTKRVIKAHIADTEFLTKYSSGSIRFYQGDKLRVRLVERQIIEGAKTKMEYEIEKVIDYTQARATVRPAQARATN